MAQRKLHQLDDDALYADWRHWIQHEIHDEWIELGSKQETFDLIAEIVQNSPRLQRTGAHLLDWMYFNYVAAIAMTLRRELDHQKTANLRHLLHEMEERPQVVTRGRYRALWPEADRRHGVWGPDRDFERHRIVRVPDDPERDHIAPEEFGFDREQLIAQTELVREFVERTFAHRSPEKPATVTLKQVHDAVDAIVEMFKKYYVLFTAASLSTHRPVAQYNTHECFTFPWWVPEWNVWGDLARDPHHGTVFVVDLERALEWYKSVLMLKVERLGNMDADLVRRRSEGGGIRIRLVCVAGWKAVPDVPVISFHVEPTKFAERYRNWRGFVLDDRDRAWMLDSEGNVLEFLKHLAPIDPAESEEES